MSRSSPALRPYDPARVFVRGGAISAAVEWAFWLVLLVWWIDVLDLSPIELVAMGLAIEITVLLAETPTGVVADLHSRKWSVVIAHALMGLAFMWSVASREFWIILPAQVLFGIGWTFQSGADVAWVTEEINGEQPGRANDDLLEGLMMRRHRYGIALSFITVSSVMLLVGGSSIRWAALACGLAKIAVASYYALAMEERHFTPGRETESFLSTLRAGMAIVRSRPRLRHLVAAVFVSEIAGHALDRFSFKHFIDSLDTDVDSVNATGLVFLVLAVTGVLTNMAVSRALEGTALKPARSVISVAIVLFVVSAVGAVGLAATAVPVLIAVGLMLQDSTRESTEPVVQSWTNRDAVAEVRATVHSLIGQTYAIGSVAGGLTLGVVAELAGVRPSLILSGAFLLAAAAVAARAARLPRPAGEVAATGSVESEA